METRKPTATDDKVVGLAAYGPYRHEDDSLDPAHGELYSIYLDPDHWGTGAGRALFGAVCQELAKSYSSLRLWVLEANPRARRFYERAGLTPDGEQALWTPRDTGVTLPGLRYSSAL